jgi:4-hydroxy-tetrahydrodipicolinate synthase
LFEAVRAKDLARAQAINDRLYPVQQAFYAPPFLDMHNRMKECLVLLGRIKRAVVRPPLMKLSEDEIARLKQALEAAGIQPDGALAVAAE